MTPERAFGSMGGALASLRDVKSIAVVGATESAGPGRNVISALRDLGFLGRIHPVNPRRETVDGLDCVPSVDAIDGDIDGAFLAIPPQAVAPVLELCGKKGAKVAVVSASGYGEGRGDNQEGLEGLKAIGRELGIRIFGPNCIGVAGIHEGVALWGASRLGAMREGTISVVSQSGAPLLAVVSDQRQLECRYLVNTGNEASIDVAELLEELVADSGTRTIGLYLEEVRDAPRFVRGLKTARDEGKAVIVLKGGRTAPGRRAAAAHTASLAGSAEVYRGVFQQFGVLEAADVDEWLNCMALADGWPRTCGDRVGGITGSGGCMVLLSDALDEKRLVQPELTAGTKSVLRKALPGFVDARNPLDLSMMGLASPEIPTTCLEALERDPNTDLLVMYLPIPNLVLANALVRLKRESTKPAVVILAHTGQEIDAEFVRILVDGDIPLLLGTTSAVSAVRSYVDAWRARPGGQVDGRGPASSVRCPQPTPSGVEEIDASGDLSGADVQPLLERVGVRFPAERRCMSLDAVLGAADAVGYPVVLKTDMAEIPHKTEMKAVHVDLRNRAELEASYRMLAQMLGERFPEADPRYVVQEYVASDRELILGMHEDATFGVVLALGLGGKLVEHLGDVALRLLPVDAEDVRAMIDQLKLKHVIEGVRGDHSADVGQIVETTLAFAELAPLIGTRLDTLELNPVMVREDGVVAVDVLTSPRDVRPGAALDSERSVHQADQQG